MFFNIRQIRPVVEPRRSYKYHTHCYLVRNLTKRAILVVIRPIYNDQLCEEALVLLAAERAAQNRWKTIFVIPDLCEGDMAYTVNATQFHSQNEYQFARYLVSDILEMRDLFPQDYPQTPENYWYNTDFENR